MITKESILEQYSEEEIFRKFIEHDFIPGKSFKSEIREENHPSANIFITPDGTWLYNDFGDKALNCFGYVMEKYGCDFIEALKIIVSEFGIEDEPRKIHSVLPKKIPIDIKTTFKYIVKQWDKEEIYFWEKYGISMSTLNEYKIKPLQWVQIVSIKDYPPKVSDLNFPIFLIKKEHKDGDGEKIYFPYESDKKKRYWSNTRAKHIFGFKQIMNHHSKLKMIGILAGEKDVMSLFSNTGIRSITLSSEGAKLHTELYLELKNKTDNLFVLYDNDRTGVKQSNKISKSFNIPNIELSTFLRYNTLKGSKGINDVSDWYKLFHKENRTKDWVYDLIIYKIKEHENSKNRNSKLQSN